MKRSKHSLSNYKLLTGDMGELIPVGCLEVLPGDSIQHASSVLTRISPLLAPVMHPTTVRVHHFFVPHRLVWEDWEDFITGGPDGFDASVFPTIDLSYTAGSPDTGSGITGELADYLGCPTKIDGLEVSALPFRAYALIFNEFYRDQDLVSELTIDLTAGADTTTNTELQNIAWEKDYFTSARPWTQKGPEITIPLAGEAPITGIGIDGNHVWDKTSGVVNTTGGQITATNTNGGRWDSNDIRIKQDATNTDYPDIKADLSGVTAANINDVRLAFALERYEEARARYGSRYTEYLRYLGIRSSDARLQRPEYLGGGKQTLQFSEVLQTAEGTNPVGELRGHGLGALRSNRYRKFFEEHGTIVSLLSVRPKTMYMQGLNKMWNRRTKEDFWQRELEHIGQQEIANKELYAAHTTPDGVFGYQDRYDEYRRQESSVAGEFRESTLNFWHLAREFASDPTLNDTLVTSVPSKRIFAEQTQDSLWMMVNHSIQARRMISATGTSYIF